MTSVERWRRKEVVLLSLELVGGIAFAYVVWDSRTHRPAWIIALLAIAAASVPVLAIRSYVHSRNRAEADRLTGPADEVRRGS